MAARGADITCREGLLPNRLLHSGVPLPGIGRSVTGCCSQRGPTGNRERLLVRGRCSSNRAEWQVLVNGEGGRMKTQSLEPSMSQIEEFSRSHTQHRLLGAAIAKHQPDPQPRCEI